MVEPRYEPRAEHVGIHANPESSNQQAPYTLTESVEILTTPTSYHHLNKGVVRQQKHTVGMYGTQSQDKEHVLTQLASKTCKTPQNMVAPRDCSRFGSTQFLPK